MAVWHNKASGIEDAYESNSKMLYEFAKQWQECAYTLLGSPPVDGKQEHEGASIRFFINGGRLKVQISCKSSTKMLFSTIEDVSQPFDQLEHNLLVGKFEFKEGTERNPSY